MGTQTVRENFQLSADLRMSKHFTKQQRIDRVDEVIDQLSLGIPLHVHCDHCVHSDNLSTRKCVTGIIVKSIHGIRMLQYNCTLSLTTLQVNSTYLVHLRPLIQYFIESPHL